MKVPLFKYTQLLIFFGLVMFICSCSFTQKKSSRLFAKAKTETYDIIVVPGVPFENGEWGRTMRGRVLWSKYLYDLGITKNIMYSGSAVYSPYPEAEIMALYAEKLGVPKSHIFTETKAEHSTENIYNSYHKARKLGFKKIALASDPFQTKMLRRFAHVRLSPDVGLIPFVNDTLSRIEANTANPTIDYQSLYVEDFISLMDRESFWERLKGTRGRNLDTLAYK
ncbi:MAG TPA: YdcF family protein [Fulvivirga sp.]|nr:YdcF family protein [Fulvivirga sp.]